ncbi:hypothetical protein N0V82_001600 [Gnomoniopsis sp. IMI 355080]|nr:hypothetical protein N0V82_001600 [Gnomoniopsis sp. IMI 355080]
MTTPADPPPKDAAKEAKEAEQAAHYALLEELDIHSIQKSFRSSTWKPNQRRNKNIKTILGDAQRREQASLNAAASSVAPTPSGAETPLAGAQGAQHDDGLSTSGASTPATASANGGAAQQQPNLAQASRSLGKLVLEKSLKPNGAGMTTGGQAGTGAAMGVTYTNIESAPSLAPQRKYCDITGLKGSYQDPKTRLRYHNAEVFGLIRGLPQGYAEQYLEARGAHTVLK